MYDSTSSPVTASRSAASRPGAALGSRGAGVVAAVVAAAVLAWTSILIRFLTIRYGLTPTVLAFWRNALVVATLLPVLVAFAPRTLRVTRANGWILAVLGVVLAAFNALWTYSVAHTGAAVATVLVYSSGAMTAVLGYFLLGERLGRLGILAVAACYAGCALVAEPQGSWRPDPAGVAAGLLSGLTYAIYGVLTRLGSKRGLDPWFMVLGAFGIAGVLLGAGHAGWAALFPAPSQQGLLAPTREPAAMGYLWLLAAGPTVVGFGLYGLSLARLPATTANLIVMLEPVVAAFIAWALLEERLGWTAWLGAGLVINGVAALQVRGPQAASGGP